MSDLTLNPMANVYKSFIYIINNVTIKYSYLAEQYETLESKQAADDYLDSYLKRDVYDNHLDYTYEDYNNSWILLSHPNAATMIAQAVVESNPDLIPNYYTEDADGNPIFARDQILEGRRNRIIREYDEQNDYYRMLIGYPPLDTNPRNYIYVPTELLKLIGVPAAELDEAHSIPLHKFQDYYNTKSTGLGNRYITKIEGNGYLKSLMSRAALETYNELNETSLSYDEWYDKTSNGDIYESEWLMRSDRAYLRYVGTNRIPLHVARQSKNFQVLKLDLGDLNFTLYNQFLIIYEQCREYYIKAIYIRDMRSIIDHYDRFSALCIMTMSIQQLVVSQLKLAVNREFFDIYAVKMLYNAYGIPYNIYLDEDTQKRIVQNLNIFIQRKATNRGLYNIAEALGFGNNFSIYKYYLSKQHKFDDYGVPLFKKTKRFNSDSGEYEIVPDYEYEYELYFHTSELRDQNFANTFNSATNHVEYKDITVPDPYWYEDSKLFNMVWETEYNFVESKYLGLAISYSLTEMMFDNILLVKMILEKEKELQDIRVTLLKITGSLEVPVFDVIILLICLTAAKHNLTGEIVSIPTQVTDVLDYMSNIEDDDDNPYLVDSFGFDFDFFLKPHYEYSIEWNKKSFRVVNDDFEPFDPLKMVHKSDVVEDIPSISLYRLTNFTDKEGYMIVPDNPNEEYIPPQPKPDKYYKWILDEINVDDDEFRCFIFTGDKKLFLTGKLSFDREGAIDFYIDKDTMKVINGFGYRDGKLSELFFGSTDWWVTIAVPLESEEDYGFYIHELPVWIRAYIEKSVKILSLLYSRYYGESSTSADDVFCYNTDEYVYGGESSTTTTDTLDDIDYLLYKLNKINVWYPVEDNYDLLGVINDYHMGAIDENQVDSDEAIIEELKLSVKYTPIITHTEKTISESDVVDDLPWIRNYKIVAEKTENTLTVVDDFIPDKDFDPSTMIKYSVISTLYKGVSVGDYLAHSLYKNPIYVADKYVYVIDQTDRVEQLLGEDGPKFREYINTLSINSSASIKEKQKAFNKIYSNIKGLYKLINYKLTEVKDLDTYRHLKTFYKTIYYSREMKKTFSIRDTETGDELRTAFNYFEYLHQLNPLLYNAVFDFDLEREYSKYLSTEEQYKRYLKENHLTEDDLSFNSYKNKVAAGEILELDSNTYPYDEFKNDVNTGTVRVKYNTLKESVIDNVSVKDERIYYLANHCISRLAVIVEDLNSIYMLGDSNSPLRDLLLKLIRFFKSFTVDIVSLDTIYVADLKPDNMLRLFENIHSMNSFKKIKERFNLPFSDIVDIHEWVRLKDDYLNIRDRFLYDLYIIFDHRNPYGTVDYNRFKNYNPEYINALFILKRKLDQETYSLLTDHLDNMKKYDVMMNQTDITILNKDSAKFFRFIHDIMKLYPNDEEIQLALMVFENYYTNTIHMFEYIFSLKKDISLKDRINLPFSDIINADRVARMDRDDLSFKDKILAITYDED